MDEIYILMLIYNKAFVLNGFISSISDCLCLTRIRKKLESISAASAGVRWSTA